MTKRSVDPNEQYLDSDDYAAGNFRPHGRSEVSTQGNIVRIETEGPFNLEAVVAINRTRSQLLASNPPGAAYAYINRWNFSALMSPEALVEYESGLRYAYSGRFRPPAAMAWIFPATIEGGAIMKSHYEKVFAAVAIPFKIFSEPESAESWVQEMLKIQDGMAS